MADNYLENKFEKMKEREAAKVRERQAAYRKRMEAYRRKLALKAEQEAEEKGLLGELKVTDWNESYWAGKTFEEYKDWMVNDFFPSRLECCQKDIDKFSKVNFAR